ncbi:hypothetical protein FNF29_05346 [Cafeteria roenbergensis]|uniref:WW domain-containing protein n=1 Tax=Cafeteria roenbergensis TaxID=33653 RepID=A0A5A8CCP1_CAFRO|nr:hypothetical protein FNF29_05346 [Cafeteria roenbergensis]|eukprot:KAA0150334.1 hypothetical protein FNF29_05346 [Cafeteria roenbergensis]
MGVPSPSWRAKTAPNGSVSRPSAGGAGATSQGGSSGQPASESSAEGIGHSTVDPDHEGRPFAVPSLVSGLAGASGRLAQECAPGHGAQARQPASASADSAGARGSASGLFDAESRYLPSGLEEAADAAASRTVQAAEALISPGGGNRAAAMEHASATAAALGSATGESVLGSAAHAPLEGAGLATAEEVDEDEDDEDGADLANAVSGARHRPHAGGASSYDGAEGAEDEEAAEEGAEAAAGRRQSEEHGSDPTGSHSAGGPEQGLDPAADGTWTECLDEASGFPYYVRPGSDGQGDESRWADASDWHREADPETGFPYLCNVFTGETAWEHAEALATASASLQLVLGADGVATWGAAEGGAQDHGAGLPADDGRLEAAGDAFGGVGAGTGSPEAKRALACREGADAERRLDGRDCDAAANDTDDGDGNEDAADGGADALSGSDTTKPFGRTSRRLAEDFGATDPLPLDAPHGRRTKRASMPGALLDRSAALAREEDEQHGPASLHSPGHASFGGEVLYDALGRPVHPSRYMGGVTSAHGDYGSAHGHLGLRPSLAAEGEADGDDDADSLPRLRPARHHPALRSHQQGRLQHHGRVAGGHGAEGGPWGPSEARVRASSAPFAGPGTPSSRGSPAGQTPSHASYGSRASDGTPMAAPSPWSAPLPHGGAPHFADPQAMPPSPYAGWPSQFGPAHMAPGYPYGAHGAPAPAHGAYPPMAIAYVQGPNGYPVPVHVPMMPGAFPPPHPGAPQAPYSPMPLASVGGGGLSPRDLPRPLARQPKSGRRRAIDRLGLTSEEEEEEDDDDGLDQAIADASSRLQVGGVEVGFTLTERIGQLSGALGAVGTAAARALAASGVPMVDSFISAAHDGTGQLVAAIEGSGDEAEWGPGPGWAARPAGASGVPLQQQGAAVAALSDRPVLANPRHVRAASAAAGVLPVRRPAAEHATAPAGRDRLASDPVDAAAVAEAGWSVLARQPRSTRAKRAAASRRVVPDAPPAAARRAVSAPETVAAEEPAPPPSQAFDDDRVTAEEAAEFDANVV